MKIKIILTLLLLCGFAGAQTQTFCSSSSNCSYTGSNNHKGTETFTGNVIADTTAPFAGLARCLSTGTTSCSNLVAGDSTGNESTEWPYLFMLYLAAQYPAYTVKYRLWDDAITDYDPPVVIQTGTGGGTRTINFTGSVNGVRLAYEDIPTFTGAIDLRVHMAPASWRPAANLSFLSKLNTPYRELRWTLKTDGTMMLELSTDGTAIASTTSTAAVTDTGANTFQWLRVTWATGSPSAVNYYTSADGITWTQIGTTVNTAVATVFQGNNSTYDVGADDWNLGAGMTGKIDAVEFHQGVNGPILNPRNIDAWQILDTATYSGAPELNVLNASFPGSGLAYWMDATRRSYALTNFQQTSVMVSLSHNEGRSTGAGEMKNYGTMFSQIVTAIPTAHLVVMTQNPRTAPATFINEHALRRAQLMSWTGSPVGYDVIDTYRAFLNDSRWVTSPGTLVNPGDGIHPTNGVNVPGNQAGELLWESVIEAAYQRSINSQSSVYTGSASLPSYLSTPTGTGNVVLNSSPSFAGTASFAAWTATQMTLNNLADSDLTANIQCGLTADKNCWMTYRNFGGTAQFQVGKNSSNHWVIVDNIASPNMFRVDITPNGTMNLAGANGQAVQFNAAANSSGSVRFFSGGASPTQVGQVTSTGQFLANGGISPNGATNQIIVNGAGAPAAGNCTTAKGGALYLRTDGTTTTTLYVCDGSTGVWTAK